MCASYNTVYKVEAGVSMNHTKRDGQRTATENQNSLAVKFEELHNPHLVSFNLNNSAHRDGEIRSGSFLNSFPSVWYVIEKKNGPI